MRPYDAAIEVRFWPKVDTDGGPGGCWLWTAATNGVGYGMFWIGDDRRAYAHRVAYEMFRGPIPDGLELDHLCREPSCVNPWHLDPVTHRENVRRGQAPSARVARSGRCASGHVRTPATSYTRNGKTYCRPCQARWAREARRRRAIERIETQSHVIVPTVEDPA